MPCFLSAVISAFLGVTISDADTAVGSRWSCRVMELQKIPSSCLDGCCKVVGLGHISAHVACGLPRAGMPQQS